MSTIRETLYSLSHAAVTFANALDEAGYGDYAFLPGDSPYDLSFLKPDALGARGDLIGSAEKIIRLAKGPQGCLASYADMVCFPPTLILAQRIPNTDNTQGVEMGTIQVLIQLGVPDKVPLQDSITYEGLAAMIPISSELLQRMVRLAALAGFLVEDESSAVRHSAMSAVFLCDPSMGDTSRMFFDIDMRAYSFFGDSVRRDPTGLNIRDGPTALAFQQGSGDHVTRPTIWEIMESNPVQSARFHATMQALGAFPSHLLRHVLTAFDWSKIRTLVDVIHLLRVRSTWANFFCSTQVGGSLGGVARVIAQEFPGIQITVQDLADVVDKGRSSLRADLCAERISFQAHDIFHKQETIADAYLLRQILHDWPDEDAERIIRNLMPAMRPGARILVMDVIVPQPGTASPYMEKFIRTYDVSMFSMFSGKERTVEQLRDIVERCDGRLRFEGISCPPGSAASLLSWVLR